MATKCETRDLAGNSRTFALFWGVPILGIVMGNYLSHPASTLLIAAGFSWAGMACVVNAYRCGRLHCFITGPLFLLAAGAVILAGFGSTRVPGTWLFVIVAVGVCLAYKLEFLFSTKYVRRERRLRSESQSLLDGERTTRNA